MAKVELVMRRRISFFLFSAIFVLRHLAITDTNRLIPFKKLQSLTTQLIEDAEPLRFRITAQGKLKNDSDVLIDQIRAIDNKRLVNGPLMQCSVTTLNKVYKLVQEVIGIY